MQLLKSLLCFQGRDNGQRFLTINAICYAVFLIMNALTPLNPLSAILIALPLAAVSALSAIRRLKDAKLPDRRALITFTVFLLCTLVINVTSHGGSYLLLLLALMTSLYVALPVGQGGNYIHGYTGPVELNSSPPSPGGKNIYTQRIEPTMASAADDSLLSTMTPVAATEELPSSQTNVEDVRQESSSRARQHVASDPFEPLRQWLSAHKKLSIGLVAGISGIIVIAALIPVLMTDPPPLSETTVSQQPLFEQAEPSSQRIIEQELAMPDSYWLQLDNNKGLSIAWQANETTDGILWSILTAKGDKSCADLRFNNGDKIRTTLVEVEHGVEYLASFSPLDTRKIIRSLAMRGSFKVCGYDFSLKGSQKALNLNSAFSDYLG